MIVGAPLRSPFAGIQTTVLAAIGCVVNVGVMRAIVPSALRTATWPLASTSGSQVPGL